MDPNTVLILTTLLVLLPLSLLDRCPFAIGLTGFARLVLGLFHGFPIAFPIGFSHHQAGGSFFATFVRKNGRPQKGILHYKGVDHFSTKGGKKTPLPSGPHRFNALGAEGDWNSSYGPIPMGKTRDMGRGSSSFHTTKLPLWRFPLNSQSPSSPRAEL